MSIPLDAVLIALLGVGVVYHIRVRLSLGAESRHWCSQVSKWEEVANDTLRQNKALLQDVKDTQALYDRVRRQRDELMSGVRKLESILVEGSPGAKALLAQFLGGASADDAGQATKGD